MISKNHFSNKNYSMNKCPTQCPWSFITHMSCNFGWYKQFLVPHLVLHYLKPTALQFLDIDILATILISLIALIESNHSDHWYFVCACAKVALLWSHWNDWQNKNYLRSCVLWTTWLYAKWLHWNQSLKHSEYVTRGQEICD